MKKRLKTLLLAGIFASLTMLQPTYGADFMSEAVKQVIRIDENGFAHSDTPQPNTGTENISGEQTDVNALPPAEQSPQEQPADTNALPPVQEQPPQEQPADTNALPPVQEQPPQEQPADTNALPPVQEQPPQEQPADTNALPPVQEQPPQEQPADTNALPSVQEQPPQEQPAQQAQNLPAGIRALDPSKPMIALTYDDGPYAPVGNRIMDVMNQYGGKCTFFMVGNRVPSYSTEVQRMAREGFEVANHTQDHPNLKKLGASQIHAQVNACNDIIQSVSGVRPTLMRLPGGNKNNTVLSSTGMPMIMWNIDTNDWKTKNAQSTVNAVLGKVKDGDIILMHELYSSTAAATETLVPALTAQGFQLVTVSELAYYRGISLNAGQLYYSIR